MPKTLLIVFCLGISCFLRSQDFSNKGKDFWVGYGTHVAMYSGGGALNANGGSQNMVLYFTSDQNANVTVTIPATGWVRTYSVTPNTVTETEIIPKTGSADARLGTEGVSNKGIHITSDRPIVAYSHIYDGSVSGASILFPTNTLGRDYYTLGFTQTSNSAYSYPFCFVIATEDNTVVEVTPSANTLTHAAGITFTQTLQKGEILNLLGQLTGGSGGNQTGVDLTGTRIRSISSGSAGCKKIAVFCGSGKINIKCNPAGNASADNTIQQCFPASAWGKKYITVPTRDMPYNFFRVMVNSPSTIVKLNGTVLNNLTNNRFYEFQSSGTNLIEANEPVTVAQFITTANQCGNTTLGGNGDPEMIYLSPVEQTLNRITLNSTFHAAINANYHYINVVMKTAGVNTFKFDGNKISGSFSPLPSDPSYSYTQIKTTAGIHNLLSDSGFNAIAYGYGSAESYGYNAGTNIVDLYQFVTLQNQYAAVNFPATCKSTPFFYAITLPYLPTSLTWDFNSNPNLSPNANITNNSPVPDSTFTRDGRTLYVFKLPGIYTFSAVGTYPIKVIANNPVSDGCSGEQEIIYDVEVFESPKADFTFTSTGCLSDSLNFNEATNTSGRPISKWIWNFGDNTTDTIKQPKKIYNTSGVYKVKLQVITDIGCISDTIKSVTINPEPIAKFGIAGPKCVGSSITFSDSSTLMEGTITQWNWDFGDGTTISSTTGNNQIHEYLTPGTFIAKLQVESALGCKSFVVTSQILVSATPYVDFSLPSICLPDGKGQFRELSTISDGTSSFFTYSWNFGDAGTSTIKDPIHNYTSVGPFSVKLTITSSSGCMKDSTKQLTTIYAQPKAAFTSNNEICLRDSMTFTDGSNGSGNSISKWRWDFGDGSTDTIQNPTHLYLSANSYLVKLFVVTEKGCFSDTASKTIIVNKLPVADFTASATSCEGTPITFTNQSVAGAGTTSNWYYSYGDGTSASYLNGNPFEKIYTNANTYTLKLAVQNSKGCKSDTATRLITINKSPIAHFLLPEVCLNDAFAEFKDSSYTTDATTPFSYAWNFGDANATPPNPNTSIAANPRHRYSATGTYNVSLTVTNVKGCTNTISYPFTVNGSVPKASFEVLDSNKLCSNKDVTIKQTSGVDFGAVTRVEIIWDNTNSPAVVYVDQTPIPNKTYTHSYAPLQSAASYSIKLRAYSGGSCADEIVKQVTINGSPKVSFTALPDACLQDPPYQLTQASETSGLPGTFAFTGKGISSAGVFNPVLAGTGLATIQYKYTSAGSCSDSASQSFTVWPNPTINAGNDIYVLEGGNATIKSVASESNLKYKWTPALYLSSDTVETPVTTPVSNIIYRTTVTSIYGCTAFDDINIFVLKAPLVPTAFSPNGDGINDLWNIKHLDNYPGSTIEIFDRYGRVVFTTTGSGKSWDGKFNGSPLPVGVYYYIINPKNGRSTYSGSVTILR